MKIVTATQMRLLEKAAISVGLNEEKLQWVAAKGVADYLAAHFPHAESFWFFCGKGHNGSDGFLASRYLAAQDKVVRCFSPYELNQADVESIKNCPKTPPRKGVMIDALLGIGARGKLAPEIKEITQHYLQSAKNIVVAIDVPTGVGADSGEVETGAVKANVTLSCGLPKQGLVREEAQNYVGRIEVISLPIPEEAYQRIEAELEFFEREAAYQLVPRRDWNAHKGSCGHVHLVAGQVGMSGAAILAAEGALASGAGLVTVHVPKSIYEIVASSVAEALVKPFEKLEETLLEFSEKAVVVVGPGLGISQAGEDFLLRLLTDRSRRAVLDADTLTILAHRKTLSDLLHEKILLTPHPGEMKRLMGGRDFSRRDALSDFLKRHSCAVLLKGPGTLVGQKGKHTSYNATGNPGMATGGMGDVLAGLCGGLAAQGLELCEAGRLGAWWHGAAADEALTEQSYETLLPRHLIQNLGKAMLKLKSGS